MCCADREANNLQKPPRVSCRERSDRKLTLGGCSKLRANLSAQHFNRQLTTETEAYGSRIRGVLFLKICWGTKQFLKITPREAFISWGRRECCEAEERGFAARPFEWSRRGIENKSPDAVRKRFVFNPPPTNDQTSYWQQDLRCPAGAPEPKAQVLQQAGARARQIGARRFWGRKWAEGEGQPGTEFETNRDD